MTDPASATRRDAAMEPRLKAFLEWRNFQGRNHSQGCQEVWAAAWAACSADHDAAVVQAREEGYSEALTAMQDRAMLDGVFTPNIGIVIERLRRGPRP